MSRQPVAEFFDSYAHDFAAIYGNDNRALQRLVNGLFRRSMRERYRRTLAACEPLDGLTVLDIGCGPGHYAVALALRGARRVIGIDFAPRMIELAKQRAEAAGVADRCVFLAQDFMAYEPGERCDYVVGMGFMDYVADAGALLSKVSAITAHRAVLSFPVSRGVLAWQRRLRYRSKTPLYMYSRSDIDALFNPLRDFTVSTDRIGRDFFVVADRIVPAGRN